MPELVQQFTAPAPPPVSPGVPPIPPEPDPPAAVPPVIDPAAWEDYAAFRETFLMYLTPPGYAAALRTVGEMLHTMILESYNPWPGWQPTESFLKTYEEASIESETAAPLCWCGRPAPEHDGREMDERGEMHRFGERRQAAEPSGEDFGDIGPRSFRFLPSAMPASADLLLAAERVEASSPGEEPRSARTLLRAVHSLLSQLDQAWTSGKPVKQYLKEMRSLRYRIDEALR